MENNSEINKQKEKPLKPEALNPGYGTSGLLSFFFKTMIVLLLCVGIGGIGTVVLGNTVIKMSSRVVPALEAKLIQLPEKEVQQYARRIRQIGEKISPIIYELKLIWKESSKSMQNPEPNLENSTPPPSP